MLSFQIFEHAFVFKIRMKPILTGEAVINATFHSVGCSKLTEGRCVKDWAGARDTYDACTPVLYGVASPSYPPRVTRLAEYE